MYLKTATVPQKMTVVHLPSYSRFCPPDDTPRECNNCNYNTLRSVIPSRSFGSVR